MKRAQAWYTDFMVGLLLFLSALAIYYLFQGSLSDNTDTIMEDMLSDAKQIANSLVSIGVPENWDRNTVTRIGITDGTQRIDNDKLQEFADIPYNETRSHFRTYFDYVVYFTDGNSSVILPNNSTYIGQESAGPEFLVTVDRLLIYNSSLVKMEVRVWK